MFVPFFFFFFLIRCAGSSSVEKLSQDGHAWDRSLCFVTWFVFADSRCKCLLLFLDMEGAKWNAVFANTAFEVDFRSDFLTLHRESLVNLALYFINCCSILFED